MTRFTLPLILARCAGSAIAAPCTGDPADGSYRCQDSLLNGTISSPPFVTMFEMLKSGVTRPAVVSEDYRRAVCDVERVRNQMYWERGWSVSIHYDDGYLTFKCAQDLEYPK